jgi:hypothetical protein
MVPQLKYLFDRMGPNHMEISPSIAPPNLILSILPFTALSLYNRTHLVMRSQTEQLGKMRQVSTTLPLQAVLYSAPAPQLACMCRRPSL